MKKERKKDIKIERKKKTKLKGQNGMTKVER